MPSNNGAGPDGVDAIERALLSVYDKTDLVEFATGLSELDIELIATGKTADILRESLPSGSDLSTVAEVTDFPEILNGRVKTLHPVIQAGLLFDPHEESHKEAMERHSIQPIGLVCVNLYPFEETAGRTEDEQEVLEDMDIGGPTMIRAAVKNYHNVAAVVSPSRYDQVLEELQANNRHLSEETRLTLAAEAITHTAHYEQPIRDWFARRAQEFAAQGS